jgi:DNA invertase Pin-like site-specific DNA recombinase
MRLRPSIGMRAFRVLRTSDPPLTGCPRTPQGRSRQDLCGFLVELHSLGMDLFLHQQGIDATPPAGKAMFQMMGVLAEFERAMIRDRVKAGIARAKDAGKHCGRPPMNPELARAHP